MATAEYEVKYEDGRTRVKLLTKEDAERLSDEDDGVKSVKRLRAVSDKNRTSVEDNENADEQRTRRVQNKRARAADENTEQ